MPDNSLERRVNELAGTTAALLAVVACSANLTEEDIKTARGHVRSLIPEAVNSSPRGSLPDHSAMRALDKIESILKSLQAHREAGGS
jgi:hypothetical protein